MPPVSDLQPAFNLVLFQHSQQFPLVHQEVVQFQLLLFSRLAPLGRLLRVVVLKRE